MAQNNKNETIEFFSGTVLPSIGSGKHTLLIAANFIKKFGKNAYELLNKFSRFFVGVPGSSAPVVGGFVLGFITPIVSIIELIFKLIKLGGALKGTYEYNDLWWNCIAAAFTVFSTWFLLSYEIVEFTVTFGLIASVNLAQFIAFVAPAIPYIGAIFMAISMFGKIAMMAKDVKHQLSGPQPGISSPTFFSIILKDDCAFLLDVLEVACYAGFIAATLLVGFAVISGPVGAIISSALFLTLGIAGITRYAVQKYKEHNKNKEVGGEGSLLIAPQDKSPIEKPKKNPEDAFVGTKTKQPITTALGKGVKGLLCM